MNRLLRPGQKTGSSNQSHNYTHGHHQPPSNTKMMTNYPSSSPSPSSRLPPRPTRPSPSPSSKSSNSSMMMWTTKTKMTQPSSFSSSSSSHYFEHYPQQPVKGGGSSGNVGIGGSKFTAKFSSSSSPSMKSSPSLNNQDSVQKTKISAHHHSIGFTTTTKPHTNLPFVSNVSGLGLSPTIRRSIDELLRDDDDLSTPFASTSPPISLSRSSSVKPITKDQKATSRSGDKIDEEFEILTSSCERSESPHGKGGFLLPRWTDSTSFVEADHDDDDDEDDDERDEKVPLVDDDTSSWTRETILGRTFAIKLDGDDGQCQMNMAKLLSSTDDGGDRSQRDRSKSWCWETCVTTKPVILSSEFPNTPVNSCLLSQFFDGVEVGYTLSQDGINFSHESSQHDRSRSRVIVNGNNVTHLQLIVCLNCGKDIFDDGTVFSKTTMRKFRNGQNTYCESCVAKYVAKKRMRSLYRKPSIIKNQQSQSHRTTTTPAMLSAYVPSSLSRAASALTTTTTVAAAAASVTVAADHNNYITLPLNDHVMMDSKKTNSIFGTPPRFQGQTRKNNRRRHTRHHRHQSS